MDMYTNVVIEADVEDKHGKVSTKNIMGIVCLNLHSIQRPILWLLCNGDYTNGTEPMYVVDNKKGK